MFSRPVFFILVGGSSLIAHFAGALPPPDRPTSRSSREPAVESQPFEVEPGERSAPTSQASTGGLTVVVDPGHGGHDRGGIPRQRVSEKAMALDVSQRLASILRKSGYRVVMTRNSDVFIPLGARAAIANSQRNAILVSVHFNSAPRSGADGIETYFYSSQSLPLATAIHHNVCRNAYSPNRGIRRRGFYVLRKARVPAVLAECGFLTNPSEARAVQNAGYRQRIAEALAAGIRNRSSMGRARYADHTYVARPKRKSTRRKSSRSRRRSSITRTVTNIAQANPAAPVH